MRTVYFLTTSLMAILLLAMSSPAFAQKVPSIDKSPHDISYFRGADKMPIVKVIYGRPAKNGRTVFGELVPFGKIWRTGANEATEVRFYKDVTFRGQPVKAGSYALFSIPGADKWTLILNTDVDQWGAYQYDEKKDVIRVEVPASKAPETIEAFSIMFKTVEGGAHMVLAWDDTQVEVPVK